MIKGLSISMQNAAGAERVATAFLYGTYIVLIALFTLLPSVVMPELMNPTQTGKFFAFVYALSAAIALFLIHKLFSEQAFILRITLLDILLGVLLLYITINRYFLQEVWGFSLQYYELGGLAVLYLVLRKLDKKFSPGLCWPLSFPELYRRYMETCSCTISILPTTVVSG